MPEKYVIKVSLASGVGAFPPSPALTFPLTIMSPHSTKLLASNIPSITNLRQRLDYGDAESQRCIIFYEDVRAFRKKYMTDNGLPGASLHDWNSAEHQTGLTKMTEAYLDRDENGQHYWPDDATSPNHNMFQYSSDQEMYNFIHPSLAAG
jgi:hypothetical protein